MNKGDILLINKNAKGLTGKDKALVDLFEKNNTIFMVGLKEVDEKHILAAEVYETKEKRCVECKINGKPFYLRYFPLKPYNKSCMILSNDHWLDNGYETVAKMYDCFNIEKEHVAELRRRERNKPLSKPRKGGAFGYSDHQNQLKKERGYSEWAIKHPYQG